jgi:hypothetical protein
VVTGTINTKNDVGVRRNLPRLAAASSSFEVERCALRCKLAIQEEPLGLRRVVLQQRFDLLVDAIQVNPPRVAVDRCSTLRRSRLFRTDPEGGSASSNNVPGALLSNVRCATEPSTGSNAFVVSKNRPLMPARLRRWLSASCNPPLVCTHECVSSCTTNVMR